LEIEWSILVKIFQNQLLNIWDGRQASKGSFSLLLSMFVSNLKAADLNDSHLVITQVGLMRCMSIQQS
jgi:hypothetical protein